MFTRPSVLLHRTLRQCCMGLWSAKSAKEGVCVTTPLNSTHQMLALLTSPPYVMEPKSLPTIDCVGNN